MQSVIQCGGDCVESLPVSAPAWQKDSGYFPYFRIVRAGFINYVTASECLWDSISFVPSKWKAFSLIYLGLTAVILIKESSPALARSLDSACTQICAHRLHRSVIQHCEFLGAGMPEVHNS